MKIALINTNRISPPIAPIGLEYIAETLLNAGYPTDLLDCCWEQDINDAIDAFFNKNTYDLVGITLRNTDDCVLTSRHTFVDGFAKIIDTVRSRTNAVIAIGGVGFSCMPESVMTSCNADLGIFGDGEFTFLSLADRILHKKNWVDLPNIIYRKNGQYYQNPAHFNDLDSLPVMRRHHVDNRRYFQQGGQAGVETKRGCPGKCIYCADPIAKGHHTRVRPVKDVIDEIENLLEQGIDHIHTCDSEFNLPHWHAKQICDEIVKRRLGSRLKWYAYCSPATFSRELAGCMGDAGCAGINFGVDSGDDSMLANLHRDFSTDDIIKTVRFCRENDISVMFDLLLGAPGETKKSIANTISLMKKIQPDRVGVSIGVRIYPNTEMAKRVDTGEIQSGLSGGTRISDPLFFLEPAVEPFIYSLLDDLIDGDTRFLFFNPDKPNQNYNYNANDLLAKAIANGHRGAYWDILRRIA